MTNSRQDLRSESLHHHSLRTYSLYFGGESSKKDDNSSPQKTCFQGAFHLGYSLLKRALGVEGMRKTHIDSLLKKCKSKCIKAIHEGIRLCLNIRVNRLPQNFITNIKINVNKALLVQTIGQIYQGFGILPTVQELFEQNLIRKSQITMFEELMNTSFSGMYKTYLESHRYLEDLKGIRNKEGEIFSRIFHYVATNFCNYYEFSKGNRPKHLKKKKTHEKLFKVKR